VRDAVTGEWRDVDPTFVPVIVWGDQAERCGERLQKGVPVHVEGRLQTNKWSGSDGVKRSRLEVVASRVQFLFVIKPKVTEVEVQTSSSQVVDDDDVIKSDGTSSSDDDEIPF
jgi:single-strand DNA-binding protein